MKIRNDSIGPLYIEKVWEEGKLQKCLVTKYKKEEDGIHKRKYVEDKRVFESFCLMPKEISPELPEAAKDAPQIDGLKRSKLITVL